VECTQEWADAGIVEKGYGIDMPGVVRDANFKIGRFAREARRSECSTGLFPKPKKCCATRSAKVAPSRIIHFHGREIDWEFRKYDILFTSGSSGHLDAVDHRRQEPDSKRA